MVSNNPVWDELWSNVGRPEVSGGGHLATKSLLQLTRMEELRHAFWVVRTIDVDLGSRLRINERADGFVHHSLAPAHIQVERFVEYVQCVLLSDITACNDLFPRQRRGTDVIHVADAHPLLNMPRQ